MFPKSQIIGHMFANAMSEKHMKQKIEEKVLLLLEGN